MAHGFTMRWAYETDDESERGIIQADDPFATLGDAVTCWPLPSLPDEEPGQDQRPTPLPVLVLG